MSPRDTMAVFLVPCGGSANWTFSEFLQSKRAMRNSVTSDPTARIIPANLLGAVVHSDRSWLADSRYDAILAPLCRTEIAVRPDLLAARRARYVASNYSKRPL